MDPTMATHSPIFPDEDWEIIHKVEFQVSPDQTAYRGTARCRGCGIEKPFECSYPEGYYFPARNWQSEIWNDVVTQGLAKRESEKNAAQDSDASQK